MSARQRAAQGRIHFADYLAPVFAAAAPGQSGASREDRRGKGLRAHAPHNSAHSWANSLRGHAAPIQRSKAPLRTNRSGALARPRLNTTGGAALPPKLTRGEPRQMDKMSAAAGSAVDFLTEQRTRCGAKDGAERALPAAIDFAGAGTGSTADDQARRAVLFSQYVPPSSRTHAGVAVDGCRTSVCGTIMYRDGSDGSTVAAITPSRFHRHRAGAARSGTVGAKSARSLERGCREAPSGRAGRCFICIHGWTPRSLDGSGLTLFLNKRQLGCQQCIFFHTLAGPGLQAYPAGVTAASQTTRGGLAYALGAHVVWGSMPLYLLLVREVPPLEYVAWRIVVTLPVCCLFLALSGARGGDGWAELKAVMADRRALGTLLASSALIGINWFLYVWAIQTGHVYAASLGYYFCHSR